jgi:hypothetical protein
MTPDEWGRPPREPRVLQDLFVDFGGVQDFWLTNYVGRFIPHGGSKVKWIRGREGAGKSHLLRSLALAAEASGMLTAELDAQATSLRGIDEFVRAVLGALDYRRVIDRLSEQVVVQMGYDPEDVAGDDSFLAWLVREHTRVETRASAAIREAVLKPLDIDLNLKTALGFALDRTLGANNSGFEELDRWFRGERVTRGRLASIGLSRPLNKLNARAILQGWGSAILAAGLNGLLITVDGLEQVLAPKTEGSPYYTRMRREETYEMLRQFIDDGDALAGIWIVVAARPEVFDDPRHGFPSYPALDARITNEVHAFDTNRFEDMLDWDRVVEQNPDCLVKLVDRWAAYLGVSPREPAPLAGSVSAVRRSVLALKPEVTPTGLSDW